MLRTGIKLFVVRLNSSHILKFILEALADAGVKQGLSRELAYRLAAQTMVGAGKMVLETKKHPGILKDDVCSPAGSTIAAVHALEKSGLRNTIMEAVEAATNRCVEMGGW